MGGFGAGEWLRQHGEFGHFDGVGYCWHNYSVVWFDTDGTSLVDGCVSQYDENPFDQPLKRLFRFISIPDNCATLQIFTKGDLKRKINNRFNLVVDERIEQRRLAGHLPINNFLSFILRATHQFQYTASLQVDCYLSLTANLP
jgi:hypothetical protein